MPRPLIRRCLAGGAAPGVPDLRDIAPPPSWKRAVSVRGRNSNVKLSFLTIMRWHVILTSISSIFKMLIFHICFIYS